MTVCKSFEMVFESIPCSIVQIYAFILAKEKKVDAFTSILISAATIAFTSAMISYDFDTSPTKRNKNFLFYGYTPDKSFKRFI